MGKTLRYGEFAFGKNGSSLKSLPAKGEGGGRRLVQFYAGGGKVRKAPVAGLEGVQEASFAPAPTKMPPAPKSAPKGALGAMAKPPKAKGAPDLMARARIPGGMRDGGEMRGAISGDELSRRMSQGSISDADERLIQRASPRAGAISDGEQRRLIDSMGSGAISDADRRRAKEMQIQRLGPDPEISKGIGSSMKRAYAKGGAAHSDVAMDKKLVKRAVHKHEASMHPGKPMTKLARGGMPTHQRKPLYGGGKC